jgi:dolichol-phosphate mannosyltransferase
LVASQHRPLRPRLSLIVPCYNEAAVIGITHPRLVSALSALEADWEIVYVNDGSADATLELLAAIQQGDPRVRVVGFSRNFGHQIAVTAGIDHAGGDVLVIIDADLQDPPELIGAMLDKWRAGFDVVYGRRNERQGESAFKRASAGLFYRFLNRLSETPIPLDTGDFRLIDRAVADALRRMPEHDRFLRGMVAWIGFRQYALDYKRDPRAAGVTKYPLRKMIAFATDGILSFSLSPLRLSLWLGLGIASVAGLALIYLIAQQLFGTIAIRLTTFLLLAVILVGGIQLMMLGIVGEYIGRIYREGKARPLYLVRERLGFEDRKPGS